MKKLITLLFSLSLISLVFIYSCSEKMLIPNPSEHNIKGIWQVEQVQMVTPPTTGTSNALMKAALVPFGLMPATNIGGAEVILGMANKWERYSSGSGKALKKILFTSEQVAYAKSDDNGDFYKTVSGGTSWEQLNFPGTNITDFSFRNDNEGYAILQNNTIFYTQDGGNSWQLKFNSPNNLSQIQALTVQSNYATGFDYSSGMGFMMRTIDSGNTWQRFDLANGIPQYFKMVNESKGWVILTSSDGFNTSFYKTNNGGANWYNANAPMNGCFYNAYCLDENNLWVVLYDCINLKLFFYKTNNGGTTWAQLPDNFKLQNVCFVDANNGYGIGDNNIILRSSTGGYNWIPQSGNPDGNQLTSIDFFDKSNGVAAGVNGVVHKFTNIIDTAYFSISGGVSNPALLAILNTDATPRYALGTFTTVYPNVINFQINNYSGGTGNITNGGGTFILDSRISITLNLSNSEKWQVVLRK